MTGFMRKVAVVLVTFAFSHAALAEKPATPKAEKPGKSSSSQKKPASSDPLHDDGFAGLGGGPPMHITLRFGTPTVKGELDSKKVARVVQGSERQLLACVNSLPPKNGKYDVTVTATVTFTIGTGGRVGGAKVTGLSQQARKCIAAEITKLEFFVPQARQLTQVSYPLIFKAEERDMFAVLSETSDPPPDSSKPSDTGTFGGGLGARGGGLGGGGSGVGTIGGGGGGIGRGTGVPRSVPTVVVGAVDTQSGLDKQVIRRYVARMMPQIRYCYERELVKNKGLEGGATVTFTIGANGRVSAVTASGLGNRNVESCIESVIAKIEFPPPNGGGVVEVRYPFRFRVDESARGAEESRTP